MSLTQVLADIQDTYNYVMTKSSDPRTSSWFLMSTPWPAYTLTLLYLIIVWVGPKIMAKRQPFQLTNVLIVYNFALILLSGYIFVELCLTTIFNPKFSKVCQPVDYSEDPMALRLAAVCWWYFISKPIEFFDTFFFILRKKSRQVTFLHVYHHSTMVMLWWIGVRFVAGGESYLSALLNSFIHVLMYSYYMLSAFGPKMQKYLWWKKYMTSLQLLQFFLILIHSMHAIYADCGFPPQYGYALIIYMVSHICLFSNFYYQTYSKKSSKKAEYQNGNGVVANGYHKDVYSNNNKLD